MSDGWEIAPHLETRPPARPSPGRVGREGRRGEGSNRTVRADGQVRQPGSQADSQPAGRPHELGRASRAGRVSASHSEAGVVTAQCVIISPGETAAKQQHAKSE